MHYILIFISSLGQTGTKRKNRSKPGKKQLFQVQASKYLLILLPRLSYCRPLCPVIPALCHGLSLPKKASQISKKSQNLHTY